MTQRLPVRTVLVRLIDYIELAGIEVTDALLFELTAIVREGASAGRDDLFHWSLERLNGRLCNTRVDIAAPTPPIRRGSIGYGRRR
jgi:hypothetical protein